MLRYFVDGVLIRNPDAIRAQAKPSQAAVAIVDFHCTKNWAIPRLNLAATPLGGGPPQGWGGPRSSPINFLKGFLHENLEQALLILG